MRFDENGFELKEMALAGFEDDSLIEVICIPKKQLMYKADTGFGMYLCDLCIEDNDDIPDDFRMSGNFITELDVGQTYKVEGIVSSYQGKKQLKASNKIKKVQPVNSAGIISLLKLLPGLGHLADVLYDEYGKDTINMILYSPNEVVKVCPVFYPELIESWQQFLADIKDDQGVMFELVELGLKPFQAKKLYSTYKERTIKLINENPYFLAKEVAGYSFGRCDKVARAIGFDPQSPLRIHEAMMTVLEASTHEGHTFLPLDLFVERCIELLKIKLTVNEMKQFLKSDKQVLNYKFGNLSFPIKKDDVEEAMKIYKTCKTTKDKQNARLTVVDFEPRQITKELKIMEMEKRLVIENDCIYSQRMYECETSVAYYISRLISAEKKVNENMEKALDLYLKEKSIVLEEKQREAVLTASSTMGGFMVIDGSAGCGKTFSLKIGLDLIEKQYTSKNGFFEVLVLAPTGKAARVATRATGIQAYTIHRALGGNPIEGFFYNSKNQLPYDCIVVDESSMLDIEIAKSFFEAVPSTTKVIFLGDTKQLPSVGAGNVLRDIIASRKVKIVTLNVVKRQGKDSGTLINANHIINKEMIETQKATGDALVLNVLNDIDVRNYTLNIASQLRNRFKLDEIQVLCPQREGVVGTNTMNLLLQKLYNPGNNDLTVFNKTVTYTSDDGTTEKIDLFFKKGDKVIHTQNNYSLPWYELRNGKLVISKNGKGVTNGECGVILKIFKTKDKDNESFHMLVKYEDKIILYSDEFFELDHSYAMTIHKSQGSEWKAVLMPIAASNIMMLDNNLIYTGYTRTKTFSAVIANKKALALGIQREKSIIRYTGLKDRLINIIQSKNVL